MAWILAELKLFRHVIMEKYINRWNICSEKAKIKMVKKAEKSKKHKQTIIKRSINCDTIGVW